MPLWITLSLALLLARTEPIRPTSELFAEVGSWAVMKNTAQAECRALTIYQRGTMVVLMFNLATGRADVAFANDRWESLRPGEKKKIDLTFFPRGQWASGQATVVTSKSDDSVALSLGFAQGLEVLRDFANADSFSLTVDGVSLGVSSLEGSRKAVEQLELCAAEAFAEGAEGDPFAESPGKRNERTSPDVPSVSLHEKGTVAAQQRIWLQLASSNDERTLLADYRRIQARKPSLFEGLSPHIAKDGERARLLIGPFHSANDARSFADSLADARIDAFIWSSPAGAAVEQITLGKPR